MGKILRQVDMMERLPQKTGIYFIIDPNGFMGNTKLGGRFDSVTKSWHDGSDTVHPTYWLEEIELPSDEKMWNITSKNEEMDTPSKKYSFNQGAKWMRDFVL